MYFPLMQAGLSPGTYIAIAVVAVIVIALVVRARKGSAAADEATNTAAAAAASPTPVTTQPVRISAAPGSAGEIKLYNVPEKQAAMVMAIVADHLKTPLNQLRFKSIRQVD